MRLFVAIVLTLLIGQLFPLTLQSQTLYAIITLPGTALHEGMHYIMALWLQGDPEGYTLWPTWIDGHMATMGHIMFVPTMLNASSVALAPYLLVFPTCYLIVLASKCRAATMIALCYIAACGFASITPSTQDWHVAMSEPASFILSVPLFAIFAIAWIVAIKRLTRTEATSSSTRHCIA